MAVTLSTILSLGIIGTLLLVNMQHPQTSNGRNLQSGFGASAEDILKMAMEVESEDGENQSSALPPSLPQPTSVTPAISRAPLPQAPLPVATPLVQQALSSFTAPLAALKALKLPEPAPLFQRANTSQSASLSLLESDVDDLENHYSVLQSQFEKHKVGKRKRELAAEIKDVTRKLVNQSHKCYRLSKEIMHLQENYIKPYGKDDDACLVKLKVVGDLVKKWTEKFIAQNSIKQRYPIICRQMEHRKQEDGTQVVEGSCSIEFKKVDNPSFRLRMI